jgi:two-component system chemotaxis response regulator CheB
MASTLTRRNAEISFKALSLGAADYIPKPESTREASAAETFHHDLIQKIRHLGAGPSARPRRPRARPWRRSRPGPGSVRSDRRSHRFAQCNWRAGPSACGAAVL